ncbi:hypothetical protein DAPPUDRAFT_322686 [Daphnia pulex]|uniref:MULE transposase domain-containing protein n=1 Tax=Daphnia pulex TaxID=6669 RepID=E9GWQ8_DAPPU|nr:hypothetical protein DAPPUDRAFT_322686 [Daphnia pulex]|eukprot:EFX76136.1 hypothetical protein DAPPUDRAFT_322686 [Daphnia pulex]
MLKEEIPSLETAKNVLICTDEEKSIVNAIEKVLRNIPHARCHIHAWKNMKEKLRSLGIKTKAELVKYRAHFYELLHCESYDAYCVSRKMFEEHLWNKDFSSYFEQHIHPDMNSMDVWALMRYGVKYVLSTNRSSPKMEHAQTCPTPDVVAVMMQSLMTQQPASPPDVYSIALMTKSSSTGQISHDKIYYGQMIKLQESE